MSKGPGVLPQASDLVFFKSYSEVLNVTPHEKMARYRDRILLNQLLGNPGQDRSLDWLSAVIIRTFLINCLSVL